MRRVLYLSRGGTVGGSQRQLHYVIGKLRSRYSTSVVCDRDGAFISDLEADGISVTVLPLSPWRKVTNFFSRYRDAENLIRFAEDRKIDLVHSSDLWMNEYLVRVGRRLGIPSVLHVRKPVTSAETRKHNFDKASSIVAISQRVERNLVAAGIAREKICLIEDGVDLEIYRPSDEKSNVLRRDFSSSAEVNIGIVGRLKPFKYQLEFLRAAALVKSGSGKSVAFYVIGEIYSDKYFTSLKEFASENGLVADVFFTGRRNDVPEILGSLDILVSLSGGSVMFEAMACGKCVVSAGFTSRKDSVHIQDGVTGVLLESREPRLLADTLIRLIEQEQTRSEIAGRASEWAREHLSTEKMIEKTGQLYDRLLED